MLNDFRYTLRVLSNTPAFTISACLVMAFGIGVNVAVFSVADAALFRPLPYEEPHRLVHVYQMVTTVAGERVDTSVRPSWIPMLRQFTHIFERIEPVRFGRRITLDTGIDQTMRIGGFSPGLPQLLGVRPQIARSFAEEDAADPAVLVLSDAYWARAFGRDPAVIGRTLRFHGRSYTVIGVMPAKFRHFAGATSDAWLPIDDAAASDVAARLRPGLSIAQAQRQLNEAVAPSSSSGRKPEFWIRPADWRRTDPPPGATTLSHVMLRGLVAAALLVLIIACANVSNLLTERTVAREREIATRLAIGASRAQVARLLMMEAVVISLLGGCVALVAASWIVEALPGLMPPGLAAGLLEFLMPTTGWRLWAFATATAICTGVLFGTIPALRAGSRKAVSNALSAARQNSLPTRRQRRIRKVFQACQLALTLVLLIGSALSLASFITLLRTPDGFQPASLLHVSLTFPTGEFDQGRRAALLNELSLRIGALPGVSAAAIGPAPVSDGYSADMWEPTGRADRAVVLHSQRFAVGPGFFRVAGMTLEQGRSFNPDDRDGAERVMIITRNAAQRLWPGESPVGRQLVMSDGGRPYTVVGVLRDLKIVDIEDDGVEMFVPAGQWSASGMLIRFDRTASVDLAEAIRQTVAMLDSRLTVERLATVDHLRSEGDPLGYSRFSTVLLTAFAIVGVVTSMMGFYGVIAFGVTRRTREIGTRLALGADARRITGLFMREVSGILLGGVLLGVAVAVTLTRVIAVRLFGISPHDPVVWSSVVGFLIVISLAVTVPPIRRATRVAPADALRVE